MSAKASTGGFEGFLAEQAAGLVILALLLAVWFIVEAVALILRVFIAHPKNKLLWAGLGLFLLGTAPSLVAGGQIDALNALTVVSTGAFLLVCKGVEIYYNQLFLPEVNRELLVTNVLSPWGQAA